MFANGSIMTLFASFYEDDCRAIQHNICWRKWCSFLPSSAIDKTEFSTSQSNSLSVSMAFFTVLDTVLSSINFVTWEKKRKDKTVWGEIKNTNKALLSWAGTSLREFILVEKWGVLSMRSSVSSRRSSTTVTSSLWNLIHSNLMADSRSGMLTRRWNEKDKMRNNEVVRSWEQNAIERVTNRESHLVFKVLFLQVLYICDHFMDDGIQHGLEK